MKNVFFFLLILSYVYAFYDDFNLKWFFKGGVFFAALSWFLEHFFFFFTIFQMQLKKRKTAFTRCNMNLVLVITGKRRKKKREEYLNVFFKLLF